MGASLRTGGNGGGGRRRRGRTHAPMSEINVTPFVDVMLVLLIIFMVTAPLLTAGVQVDLPEAKGRPIEAQQKPPVIVTVTKDAKIYFGDEDKKTMTLEEVVPRLKAILDARDVKDDAIYLRGDDAAAHGFVSQVLSRIRDSGFKKVSIVLKDKQGG